MSKTYADAESVQTYAQRIIPTYHPELATARIRYIFVDKASMKSGRPVLGKARKLSGALEYLLANDFLVEIALDMWNGLDETARTALVDHLLEWCTGEEDEETGDMKWTVREPDVREFSTILRRHGAWNEGLVGFVEVARAINIDERVREVTEEAETVNVQA